MFKLYIFDEVNQDYIYQTNTITDQLKNYKNQLEEYKKKLNSDQINPDTIKQALFLVNEPTAKAKVDLLSNIGNPVISSYTLDERRGSGWWKDNIWINWDKGTSINSEVFKVTYTGLQRSHYNNAKISKITAVISNIHLGTAERENEDGNPSIEIAQDPAVGFSYRNISSFDISFQYFDESGNLIHFTDNVDGSSAWITIGSLNAGYGRQEGVSLLSTGKVYGFKDSSVTVHNGNTLYSDKANDSHAVTGGDWRDTTRLDQSQYPWGDTDWDSGLSDIHAYYGAGVTNIYGNNIKFRAFTNRDIKVKRKGNFETWITFATTIVKSNSGIVIPKISYHLDSSKKGY